MVETANEMRVFEATTGKSHNAQPWGVQDDDLVCL